MKRILSLIMAFVMLASFSVVVNAEETTPAIPEKVEISFKVGDSTLMINGNAVTVETPYVVGAGTTLVPLRVITEAFGARVTWVDATKEIILEYPDVNITLQIGNINATVNDHTETLPEAPVLSPNGVTMVPLRFISETFGATVGYDNETAAITVVKETAGEDDTISSSTDLPRIGDSYWGWSMMTPSSMMMTDRLLDGSNTVFEGDNAETFYVYLYDVSEEGDTVYEDSFNELKKYLTGYTLSKSEKTTDAFGNKAFRIIARDKEVYMDFYSVFRDGYCFEVGFVCEAGSEAIQSLSAILESFKLEFAADDAEKASTHDLSNVGEDGYRLINDEELGVSLKVPATCLDANPDQINVIYFVSGETDNCTEIALAVYTKDENTTAKKIATEDCQSYRLYRNPEFTAVSDVHPYKTTDLGEEAYYYWYTTDGLYSGDMEFYDIFFEKGDFVYNIAITLPEGEKEIYETVMRSLEVKELDSNVTGVYLHEEDEITTSISSCSAWSMEVPSNWTAVTEPTAQGAGYLSENTGAALILNIVDGDDISHADMFDLAEAYCDSVKGDGKVVQEVSKENLGTIGYYTFQICITDEDNKLQVYNTVYMTLISGKLYIFIASEMQEHANAGVHDEIETMITSFDIK